MKKLHINRGLFVGFLIFATLLVPLLSEGSWAADFESYSVPAASAIVCPDVPSTTGCVVDVDNTSEGAGVNMLVAAAHATAWKDNGSARALGLDGTAANSNGWLLATLRTGSSSDLPPEIAAEGGKVVVRMTGSALGTATARSGFVNVFGKWTLEIGPPAQTQVWSDGTSNNYGAATIGGGPMLLSLLACPAVLFAFAWCVCIIVALFWFRSAFSRAIRESAFHTLPVLDATS